jgi:hypothetical protein
MHRARHGSAGLAPGNVFVGVGGNGLGERVDQQGEEGWIGHGLRLPGRVWLPEYGTTSMNKQ